MSLWPPVMLPPLWAIKLSHLMQQDALGGKKPFLMLVVGVLALIVRATLFMHTSCSSQEKY